MSRPLLSASADLDRFASLLLQLQDAGKASSREDGGLLKRFFAAFLDSISSLANADLASPAEATCRGCARPSQTFEFGASK
jgi:hypothetical protein